MTTRKTEIRYDQIDNRTVTIKTFPLMTLWDWIEGGHMEPGQRILIGKVKDDVSTNTEVLYVGNCTPMNPPEASTKFTWWDDHPYKSLFVLEVSIRK